MQLKCIDRSCMKQKQKIQPKFSKSQTKIRVKGVFDTPESEHKKQPRV